MGETDKSKTCVWRWQDRFMHEGVGGLLRDKSRPPGKAPIAPDRVASRRLPSRLASFYYASGKCQGEDSNAICWA